MKIYDVSRLPAQIVIGYDGENNWRPHSFDCSPLLANHPNGTISLWLLPNGETQAFPVALTRDGNTVVWTPLAEEMTAATGALQLVCTDGTDVGKSAVVLFRVDESILPGAEHPAAVPSWATETIERAESAADRAEEAAESIDVEHLEQTIASAVEEYLEEHPVQAPVQSVNGKTGAVDLDASDVGALPSDTVIPPAVTEQDVAGWGFTKNTGDYTKPSTGIPKTDLSADVQTSLGKADTALQQHQSLSGYATETWVGQQIAAIPDELPVVSASDDGKVLGVVNGAWTAKADEGGGSAPFVIPISQSGSTWTTTATAAEILDHVDNCVLKQGGSALYQAAYGVQGSNAQIVFSNTDSINGFIQNVTFTVTVNNGTVAIGYYRAEDDLPTVSASDNGKFLRVVSGAWAAASVPAAESNSFGGGS